MGLLAKECGLFFVKNYRTYAKCVRHGKLATEKRSLHMSKCALSITNLTKYGVFCVSPKLFKNKLPNNNAQKKYN